MKYLLVVTVLLFCGNVYAAPVDTTVQTQEDVHWISKSAKWFHQHRPVRKWLWGITGPNAPAPRTPKTPKPV